MDGFPKRHDRSSTRLSLHCIRCNKQNTGELKKHCVYSFQAELVNVNIVRFSKQMKFSNITVILFRIVYLFNYARQNDYLTTSGNMY